MPASRGWTRDLARGGDELLGAYALHAVDVDEVTEVEAHLDTCPRCRAELDGLARWRAPWATRSRSHPRVCGRASSAGCRAPRRHRAGPTDASVEPPGAVALSRPSAAPRSKRSRGAVATIGAFAVAAAAVAVVLGIGLVQADHKVSNLQGAASHQVGAAVAAALQSPVTRWSMELDHHPSPAGRVRGGARRAGLPGLVRPAQAPLGQHVPALGDRRQPGNLAGAAGRRPKEATFTMAGSVQPRQLSITAEPAGGSVVPTTSIVATGTV